MNGFRRKTSGLARFILALAALFAAFGPALCQAAQEETFPLLQIGTTTYTNVTVTTKARKYIFVLHSSGMANIRVADLPPDVKQALGYADLEKKEEAKKAVFATWMKQTLGRFETPQVRAMERDFQSRLQANSADQIKAMIPAHRDSIIMISAGVLLIYLLNCYCWMLICKKAGSQPGLLIWLPLLQIFPILRAAGMSPLWFLALFIPGINIIAGLVLCFRVAKARQKSPLVGFLLAFPLTSFFTFLYLAFSSGREPEIVARRVSTGPVRLGAI
jgi:hypothetical protein